MSEKVKLKASIVPYSSVVGQSVGLRKPNGEVAAQIMICGASKPISRETAEALGHLIVAAINQLETEFDVN